MEVIADYGNNEIPEVIIADDNIKSVTHLSESLKNLDYSVFEASSGRAVLDRLKVKKPDLILLDIEMPGMDGFEVCKKIKSDKSLDQIPIIFISGYGNEANKVDGFNAGAVDYITKPIRIDESVARIHSHITQSRQKRELNDFNQILVKREMRIIELKQEVNSLLKELGREIIYKAVDRKN